MLHPSYTELMEKINKEGETGEEPVINSRYSIVIATSKRAREIIGGDEPFYLSFLRFYLSFSVFSLYCCKPSRRLSTNSCLFVIRQDSLSMIE